MVATHLTPLFQLKQKTKLGLAMRPEALIPGVFSDRSFDRGAGLERQNRRYGIPFL